MADLTPNNREEYWLKGMVDGQTTLEPNERREYWYKEIVDAIGSGGGGGTGGGVLEATMTVDVQARTLTLDKTYNDIIAAPFTVVKHYGETTVDFAFISFATHSNVMWSVYMPRIEEGNIETMMFEAESPDAPLVCHRD